MFVTALPWVQFYGQLNTTIRTQNLSNKTQVKRKPPKCIFIKSTGSNRLLLKLASQKVGISEMDLLSV